MESEDKFNDLRVASFSCYLKPHESSNVKTGFDDFVHKDSIFDLKKLNPNIFTARTPSISSEASGWNNSQSALLRRNVTASPRKQNGTRFFHRFSCTGPCSTKKAVYVEEVKIDQFAFPILTDKNPLENGEKVRIEESRKSIEVFGSGAIKKCDIARNLERKMSILTWDAIPKVNDGPVLPLTFDDVASEASSDLFEIENISRQPSCVMSPSTRYAPSEASIEWSVVTASAVEFGSVYSDYDSKNAVNYTTSIGRKTAKTKIEREKKAQKNRSSGFLGCKSNKSVKVCEPMSKTTQKSKY